MSEPASNLSTKDRRTSLFKYLDRVIELSDKKIHLNGNADRLKQGWARVLVQAIGAYGSLLKDVELEDLELRIKLLEEKKP